MSNTLVAVNVPLPPNTGGMPASWNEASAGAQAPGSEPGATDLLNFQQTMDEVRNLRESTNGQRPAAVLGVGPLQSLSKYLTKQNTEMADLQEKSVMRRDPQSALDLNLKMADMHLESQLLFTAVGKGFSGISELIKLS